MSVHWYFKEHFSELSYPFLWTSAIFDPFSFSVNIPEFKNYRLVSRFTCNTRLIVNASSSLPVSLMSNSCSKT